jgi:hypothetical protein
MKASLFLCLLVMAGSPGLVKGTSPMVSPDHITRPQARLPCAWAWDDQPSCRYSRLFLRVSHGSCFSTGFCRQWRPQPAFNHSCFVLLNAAGRKLRQQGGVCGAFASASATAVSTGGTATAQSQAIAQSICKGLRDSDGTAIAQAISQASSTGNAETVAQAIAEAASGGETQIVL